MEEYKAFWGRISRLRVALRADPSIRVYFLIEEEDTYDALHDVFQDITESKVKYLWVLLLNKKYFSLKKELVGLGLPRREKNNSLDHGVSL
jgi:hypothetical protein